MRRLAMALLLVAPFLLGTTPHIVGLKRMDVSDVDPPRLGHWRHTPTVVLCEGAPTDRKSIDRAVRWWENHGHRFYNTVDQDDPLGKCDAEFPDGFITIKVGNQTMFTEGDDLAETHFYVDTETKEISWAKIYLKSSPIERVLEHEIGHALGFMHSKKPGHLMYPTWIRGGWGDRGVREVVRLNNDKGILRR